MHLDVSNGSDNITADSSIFLHRIVDMNERIKELASKIDRIKDLWDVGPVQRAAIEDFANLIIQECAGIGSNIVLAQTEDNDMGVFLGIKKHFGVEE